jgi:LytS/YehU family sensor histidine kinase
MNPHFIFNALNTIQAYIYTNNQEKAAGYLQKFSELTRRILNMSNTDTIPLREEFRALQLYLDLEQQRLEEPADVIWDIDPRLDIDLIHIPSMLIQPYLENAIKHGLLHKKGKKELTLRFTSRGENLEIQVEDNGIGRKRAAEMKSNRMEQHQSFAVGANKKRLDILNHGRKTPIIMAIVDKYGENQEPLGTRVTLSIPRFSSNPS